MTEAADLFSLTGRIAVITGASSGIGQAIAAALAAAGADIAVVGRSASDETAARVQAAGRRFLSVTADLSTTAACKTIVEEVARGLGGIDILVNNAGIIRRREALELS